jgi:hypothetical protein
VAMRTALEAELEQAASAREAAAAASEEEGAAMEALQAQLTSEVAARETSAAEKVALEKALEVALDAASAAQASVDAQVSAQELAVEVAQEHGSTHSQLSKRDELASAVGLRWCRKCRAVFRGDQCDDGHANFMYTAKIPVGVDIVPSPSKSQKPLAGAPVALQPDECSALSATCAASRREALMLVVVRRCRQRQVCRCLLWWVVWSRAKVFRWRAFSQAARRCQHVKKYTVLAGWRKAAALSVRRQALLVRAIAALSHRRTGCAFRRWLQDWRDETVAAKIVEAERWARFAQETEAAATSAMYDQMASMAQQQQPRATPHDDHDLDQPAEERGVLREEESAAERAACLEAECATLRAQLVGAHVAKLQTAAVWQREKPNTAEREKALGSQREEQVLSAAHAQEVEALQRESVSLHAELGERARALAAAQREVADCTAVTAALQSHRESHDSDRSAWRDRETSLLTRLNEQDGSLLAAQHESDELRAALRRGSEAAAAAPAWLQRTVAAQGLQSERPDGGCRRELAGAASLAEAAPLPALTDLRRGELPVAAQSSSAADMALVRRAWCLRLFYSHWSGYVLHQLLGRELRRRALLQHGMQSWRDLVGAARASVTAQQRRAEFDERMRRLVCWLRARAQRRIDQSSSCHELTIMQAWRRVVSQSRRHREFVTRQQHRRLQCCFGAWVVARCRTAARLVARLQVQISSLHSSWLRDSVEICTWRNQDRGSRASAAAAAATRRAEAAQAEVARARTRRRVGALGVCCSVAGTVIAAHQAQLAGDSIHGVLT